MIKHDQEDYSTNDNGYQIDCSSANHLNLRCVLRVSNPSQTSNIASTTDSLRIIGLSEDLEAGS